MKSAWILPTVAAGVLLAALFLTTRLSPSSTFWSPYAGTWSAQREGGRVVTVVVRADGELVVHPRMEDGLKLDGWNIGDPGQVLEGGSLDEVAADWLSREAPSSEDTDRPEAESSLLFRTPVGWVATLRFDAVPSAGVPLTHFILHLPHASQTPMSLHLIYAEAGNPDASFAVDLTRSD